MPRKHQIIALEAFFQTECASIIIITINIQPSTLSVEKALELSVVSRLSLKELIASPKLMAEITPIVIIFLLLFQHYILYHIWSKSVNPIKQKNLQKRTNAIKLTRS
jgi:hypothetical protein